MTKTKTKLVEKISRQVVKLGKTNQTRIVIDTIPQKITKEYRDKNWRGSGRKQKLTDENLLGKDSLPRVSQENYLSLPLHTSFKHGKNHFIKVPVDFATYQKLLKIARANDRTLAGQIRYVVLSALFKEGGLKVAN